MYAFLPDLLWVLGGSGLITLLQAALLVNGLRWQRPSAGTGISRLAPFALFAGPGLAWLIGCAMASTASWVALLLGAVATLCGAALIERRLAGTPPQTHASEPILQPSTLAAPAAEPAALTDAAATNQLSRLADYDRVIDRLERTDAALRQASQENRRLISALSQLDTGVAISDPRWTDNPIIFANLALLQITGYTSSELVGRNQRILYGSGTDASAVQAIEAAMSAHQPYHGTLLTYRADGSPFWNEITITPVFDEDHALLNFVASQRDVSAQVALAASLHRREAILRAVRAAAADFLAALDWTNCIDAVLAYLGEAATISRIYLYQIDHTAAQGPIARLSSVWNAPGIATSQGWTALQSLAMRQQQLQRWETILRAGALIADPVADLPSAERQIATLSGAYAMALMPIMVDGGWWGILAFHDCVEARTWSEAELDALRAAADMIGSAVQQSQVRISLAASEQRYRTMVTHLPGAVYRSSADRWEIQFISEGIADLIGISASSFASERKLRLIDYVHSDDQAALLSEPVSAGRPYLYEYRLIAADGRVRWVQDRGIGVFDTTGRLKWRDGLIVDITERRNSELAYRGLVEQSLQGLAVIQDNTLQFANQALSKILGYTFGTFQQLNLDKLFDLIHPADAHYVKKAFYARMQGENVNDQRFRVRRPDGELRWLESFSALIEYRGRPALQVVTLDITDRYLSEAKVRRSEERLREMGDLASVGWWSIDLASCTGSASARVRDILGFDVEETPDMAAITSRFATSAVSQLLAITIYDPPDKPWSLELPLADERRWVRLIGHTECEGTLPIRINGALQEITEQKEYEQALFDLNSELEQRVADRTAELARVSQLLQTIFEGLPDGLALLDRGQRVLTINSAMRQSFHNLTDLAVDVLLPPDAPGYDLIAQTFANGRSHQQHLRVSGPAGGNLIFAMQTLPVSPTQGVVEQVIVHAVDITARLKLEARVLENERFAASGRIAATVAHEINTPLQAVQGFLYLSEHGSPEQRADYLKLSLQEVERIGRIVYNLQNLYRPMSTIESDLDLNTLIGRVLLLVDHVLARSDVQVIRELEPQLPLIWGRADQLTQVLINLLVNAIQAMPAGGTLSIRTRHRPASGAAAAVVIEIADEGVGIPPTQLPHIFEPFFTSKAEGSGLGLAISAQIINDHHGQIDVESQPGIGSTFRISLPLTPPLAELG